MSFGLLVAGFLATTNAGRVALARRKERPSTRLAALSLLAGLGLVVVGAALADPLLGALAISPESFRIAAGLVLGGAGLRTLVWPTSSGPFAAVLVTPELAILAVGLGADEGLARVLGAAAIVLPLVAVAALVDTRVPAGRTAQFLAALQIVVGVALVVAGVRDV